MSTGQNITQNYIVHTEFVLLLSLPRRIGKIGCTSLRGIRWIRAHRNTAHLAEADGLRISRRVKKLRQIILLHIYMQQTLVMVEIMNIRETYLDHRYMDHQPRKVAY